jgi:tRNA G10  N-methylase Trm11
MEYMKHFLVFGSHPKLSWAEFSACRPSAAKSAIFLEKAALTDDPAWLGEELIRQLGGTVKLGDVVWETEGSALDAQALADWVLQNPRGAKVLFGFSVYGGNTALKKKLEKLPVALKRALKAQGKSVRWVTSQGGEPLSPAAVTKLKLTSQGYDFVLLVHDKKIAIGLTTQAQDADAWSLRDYGRPAREAKAGMLPPKLAHVLVNLAQVPEGGTLFDPFCGSGTILMEAALATQAGKILGSDIDPQQIKDAEANLDWLVQQNIFKHEERQKIQTFVSDIRDLTRRTPNLPAGKASVGPTCTVASVGRRGTIDCVVTEGYLGPPLRGSETKQELERTATEITNLWRTALQTLYPLLKKDGRIVCVWPSFKTQVGSAYVNLSKDPELLKNYRVLNPEPLIYHREGQFVTRQIFILEKGA